MEITPMTGLKFESIIKTCLIVLAVQIFNTSCKRDSHQDFAATQTDSIQVDSSFTTPGNTEGAFSKTLETKDIKVDINSTGNDDLKNLEVTINGNGSNSAYNKAIRYDGIITDAVTADLNRDGNDEVYIFNQSAGSGSYGQLFAYQYNGKRLDSITIDELSDELSEKYLGHDSFSVDQKYLYRYFPLYNEMDANCCPTGGIKQLKYTLVSRPSGLRLLLNSDGK